MARYHATVESRQLSQGDVRLPGDLQQRGGMGSRGACRASRWIRARSGPAAASGSWCRSWGVRMTLTYEVISLVPGREVVLAAASGVLRATDRIVVTGHGSMVSYDAEVRLRGPLRVLDPVLRPGFRAVAERAAAGLGRALSGRPPLPGSTAPPGTPVGSDGTAPRPGRAP